MRQAAMVKIGTSSTSEAAGLMAFAARLSLYLVRYKNAGYASDENALD
jgi:hypothetical protein